MGHMCLSSGVWYFNRFKVQTLHKMSAAAQAEEGRICSGEGSGSGGLERFPSRWRRYHAAGWALTPNRKRRTGLDVIHCCLLGYQHENRLGSKPFLLCLFEEALKLCSFALEDRQSLVDHR